MFIYCFDETEKIKLQNQLNLLQDSNIDNKRCWIFTLDNNTSTKFNLNQIDKGKCIVSNKLMF